MNEFQDRLSRYRACMVLGGVGDALGYNDGKWEFCSSGEKIQEEVRRAGGVSALRPTGSKMRVSDDTVLHLATAEALLSPSDSHEQAYLNLAASYKQAMSDMNGRSPGATCIDSVKQLIPDIHLYAIPFNPRGGGCGAAMRAVPIGLLYWRPEAVDSLVRVAVEAGRMTHNHPTGFLGSVAVAVFVSYAVQGREVREWGEGLLHTLQIAKRYCEQQKRDWKEIRENWSYFEDRWSDYLNLVMPRLNLNFKPMSAYEYDQFTLKLCYTTLPGSSGHDAPMIAYDALLRSMQGPPASRWETVCRYGMFHGGDSDSTGIIAGACYGAMFGLEGVPPSNYSQLEYRDRLERLGESLFAATLSESRVKSKPGDFHQSIKHKPILNLTRSDGFTKDDSFSQKKKKKVTFKDLSPSQGTTGSGEESEGPDKPDLFILASMRLDEPGSECKISKQKSILKRRSRSHSPTKSSGFSVDFNKVDELNEKKYKSKEVTNISKRLLPDSVRSNFEENNRYKSSNTTFADNPSELLNHITKRSVNPARAISYPPHSHIHIQRTDITSTLRVERVIRYPPKYEERRLQDKILRPTPSSNRSSFSHRETTDG